MPSQSKLTWAWIALTAVLVLMCAALNAASGLFAYDRAITDRPAVWVAGALTAAGLVYLLTIPLIARSLRSDAPHQSQILWIILAGGLAMRLVLMGSTPVLEDDWVRYLWDGGVTAQGFNPYAASPDEAQGEAFAYSLQPLAQQSGIVIERVNHSDLTTVYPPVAQAAFALAHLIKPWSLEAWRAVCLAAEAATLALLLSLLDAVGRSRVWVALYWLSPLAAKELINSAHMEAIVTPFVLAAVLLSIKQRHLSAVGVLGLAIGAKIWPLVLAPLVLRPLLSSPRRLAAALAVLVIACLAATAPYWAAGAETTSGITAYASYWRNNSAHYGLLENLFSLGLKPFATDARTPGMIVRGLLAALAAGFAMWLAIKPITNGQDHLRRAGLATAALVLLSPSQFPWYALWMLPFVVFSPWSGLLLMTALISIYYAGFHFSVRDSFAIYRDGLVFAIWLPVWALLAIEAWRIRVSGRGPLIDDGAQHA